jgi:hypothetical protein
MQGLRADAVAQVERHVSFEHRHRNVHGGVARAAIFGVSDGLTTNISLVLGVAAANTGRGFVQLAGLAGLLAGSFSMAAGEYVSMRAQAELFARELRVEEAAILAFPDIERDELARIYRSRGLRAELADEVASQLMRDSIRRWRATPAMNSGFVPINSVPRGVRRQRHSYRSRWVRPFHWCPGISPGPPRRFSPRCPWARWSRSPSAPVWGSPPAVHWCGPRFVN